MRISREKLIFQGWSEWKRVGLYVLFLTTSTTDQTGQAAGGIAGLKA
ncbi:MAG: hypothetical protein ACKO81_06310 [Planctomycetota bacterium]